MRSLNSSVGTAAYSTAAAVSTLKLRSGMRVTAHNVGTSPQRREKLRDLRPDLVASGQALPVGPNQADEPETLVYRSEIVLRGSPAVCLADAVDEQSFNIGVQFAENRVLRDDVGPCVEGKK